MTPGPCDRDGSLLNRLFSPLTPLAGSFTVSVMANGGGEGTLQVAESKLDETM